MDLITIKTFDFSHKAHLMKSMLDNEGIESYVFDENIVNAFPLYSNTVGGIKVKINKQDFEKVCRVLEGTEYKIVLKSEIVREQEECFANHIFVLVFSKEVLITLIVAAMIFYLCYEKFFVEIYPY